MGSIYVLKPHTFMNIIGLNVAKALKSNRIEKTTLVVINDDLEQKLGKFRAVRGTSFK